MNDLQQLLALRATEGAAAVLEGLKDGLHPDPAASGEAADLHKLLLDYFGIERVAVDSSHRRAFRKFPDAAARLAGFVEEDGAPQIAALMRSLIDGKPQPLGALKAGLKGPAAAEAARHGPGVQAALAAFAQVALRSKGTSAELELSLGWPVVEEALVDRVETQAARLAFAHGPLYREAAARNALLDSAVAAADMAALFSALVDAPDPTVLARASEWDIAHDGASAEWVEVPVRHRPRKAALRFGRDWPAGTAADQLRALYACSNGGTLFVPMAHRPKEPGLELIPDESWEAERSHIMDWIEMGREEEAPLPDWVHTLVPIAALPGDASRWVVPLEGPFAGAVLLSNDDVPEGPPRYQSVAHFVAALRLMPHEILGCGGYVSYIGPGKRTIYPEGYRDHA